jgi:hypothetical protein
MLADECHEQPAQALNAMKMIADLSIDPIKTLTNYDILSILEA